ncbi:UNVERIFIED_CONTAM: hypothetical protein B566_EDAN019100 [Ephemera danica]|nr:hypothetical protein B566_EDAN019100 [Ephemera danica]
MKQLMTPFRNNGALTAIQRNYNYKHSSTRMTIERSFGHLKCRWRRLHYLDMSLIKFIPKVILACSVLHNICILQSDGQFELPPIVLREIPPGPDDDDRRALQKRERIARNI